jgi:hypothetical protein
VMDGHDLPSDRQRAGQRPEEIAKENAPSSSGSAS